MRIAICLSGFMRTFEATYASLQTCLSKCNEEQQIDFFISTWNKQDGHLPTLLDWKRIENLYHPKEMIIDPPKLFDIPASMIAKNFFNKRDPQRIYSMFYKIKECDDLRFAHELRNNFTYDCVIRMRADIKLEQDLIINQDDLKKINIPMFGDFIGLNDQIAWSNSSNMYRYCRAFDHLEEYIEHLVIMDPELFLKSHILSEGIPVKRVPLNYKLLCHGQVLDNLERETKWISDVRK